MSRYIDAGKLMKVLEEDIPITDNPVEVMASAIAALEEQPPADVRENVKGEWLSMFGHNVCNKCGFKIDIIPTNFCPNCGAQMMRGEANE